MKKVELKPCLCGEKNLIKITDIWNGDHDVFYGLCGACGFISDGYSTIYDAIVAWNTRRASASNKSAGGE